MKCEYNYQPKRENTLHDPEVEPTEGDNRNQKQRETCSDDDKDGQTNQHRSNHILNEATEQLVHNIYCNHKERLHLKRSATLTVARKQIQCTKIISSTRIVKLMINKFTVR